MAKYSKDLNENLVNKVKALAASYSLTDSGVKVEAVALNKVGKDVVEIAKGNDVTKLFSDKDVVVIALLEEAFLSVDDKTQNMWIESALSQIYYDSEKEKIKIEKPEITVTAGMYNKYKGLAVDMAVLAQLTIEQIREQEKERKEQEKLLRKEKKSKKS